MEDSKWEADFRYSPEGIAIVERTGKQAEYDEVIGIVYGRGARSKARAQRLVQAVNRDPLLARAVKCLVVATEIMPTVTPRQKKWAASAAAVIALLQQAA